MKKMMKLFAAAFVAIVAVSCVKEMNNGASQENVKMVDVTFGADLNAADEGESKAHVGYNGDTPVMHWTEGDKVAVINANTKEIYEFALCGGENTSNGVFTGQVPEADLVSENQEWCIVYPFACVEKLRSKATTSTEKHVLDAVLPTEQAAVNGGFDEGVNMLVDVTTSLDAGAKMFPIGTFLRLDLAGSGITSVTVFNNDNRLNSGLCRPNLVPSISTAGISGSYLNPTGSNSFQNKVVLVPSAGQETILPGTYYLVCRDQFEFGMTLKFTNSEGKVAYYSSNTDEGVKDRNKTIHIKHTPASPAWDASVLNWKNEEKVVLDFSSQLFEEALPTTKNTSIDGTYTLPSSSRQVKISTTAAEQYAAFTPSATRGLLFSKTGDYIEFPAVPGKKLKEVQVTTAYKSALSANVTDENGVDMDGEYVSALYAGNVYSYILPRAEINKRYRYVVKSVSNGAEQLHLQKITLIYSGDDVAEISGVTASAVNSFDGFTVKGELLGGGLDAATWGIEYGTSADALSEAATGNGGKIDQFVEAAPGTYYVRVWASADGGENKTYSETVTVTVAPFSGTITLDFSYIGAVNNISYVGTSVEGRVPETVTYIHNFVNEAPGAYDYYTYTNSEGVWPFTMCCHDESDSDNAAYGFQTTSTDQTITGIRLGKSRTSYWWISLPNVPGYRLTGIKTWSNSYDARFYVCTSEKETFSKNRVGFLEGANIYTKPVSDDPKTEDVNESNSEIVKSELDDNGLYLLDLDVKSKSHAAEDQLWLTATSNRIFNKFILSYETVN